MNPIAKQIRKDILIASMKCGHGRLPTDYSIIEMLLAVYGTMRHDPRNPEWPERDYFILSKGHATLAHYCVLAYLGYFPLEDCYTTGGYQSKFGGHADRLLVPGVEVSTGSLGLGIGVAVGIALALKIKNSNQKVFTLIGDGESNEGSVWEAVMIAADQKLSNLTIIYDHNKSQTRSLQIWNPVERFKSFECDAYEVNGHNISELEAALRQPTTTRPKAIIGNAEKGYGCERLIKEKFAWHRRTPNDQEFRELMEELNAHPIS